jgi:transposase
MSLHPHVIAPVPEATVRVARAAFPKGHPYLTFRDALGPVFQDEDFTALFPLEGHPGLPPWRLALVTIMQFREHLADRQAAEAVRARIDWKYLLGLELTDPGFDFSVLSEFRDRLLTGSAASCCWTSCSSGAGRSACSKRGASSAPTPPMCSRLSGS